MKKSFISMLTIASLFTAVNTYAIEMHNVDGPDDPNGKECVTNDGTYRDGTFRPSGAHYTKSSNASTSNSHSQTTTSSETMDSSLKLTDLGVGTNSTQSNGSSRSANAEANSGSSTTYDYICVPNNR